MLMALPPVIILPISYFVFKENIDWGLCPSGEICSEFNWLRLVIDIIFWYVVSIFIISRLEQKASIR